MADHLSGRKIKPQSLTPVVQQFRAVADEAITAGDILYPSGADGEWMKVAIADKDNDKVKAGGKLLVSLNTCAAGDELLATTMAKLNTLDTSSAAVDDPVYLGDDGNPTLTLPAAGHVRKVGEVSKVATVANGGMWVFEGVNRTVIVGKAVVASGTAAVTVAAATLGGSFGGAPALATMNEDDGAVTVANATWSTNDLVINTTANTTADRDVTYMVIL